MQVALRTRFGHSNMNDTEALIAAMLFAQSEVPFGTAVRGSYVHVADLDLLHSIILSYPVQPDIEVASYQRRCPGQKDMSLVDSLAR